jgi:hypothetical protein
LRSHGIVLERLLQYAPHIGFFLNKTALHCPPARAQIEIGELVGSLAAAVSGGRYRPLLLRIEVLEVNQFGVGDIFVDMLRQYGGVIAQVKAEGQALEEEAPVGLVQLYLRVWSSTTSAASNSAL